MNMMQPAFHPPLCPMCPDCKRLPMWFCSIMGYWECFGSWVDEPMRYWVICEGGELREVSGDTYVDDDGSLKVVQS